MRKRWHNAPKRAPEKEARLLWFSTTSADASAAPDQTPTPEQTSTTEELADQTVNAGTAATKDALKDALKEKEGDEQKQNVENNAEAEAIRQKTALRERFEQTIKAATDNSLKLQDLKRRMQSPIVMKRLQANGNPVLLSRWQDDIRLLNREEINSTQEKDFATALFNFWEGSLSPKEFIAHQKAYMQNLPYGFEDLGAFMDAEFSDAAAGDPHAHASSNDAWATSSMSDRIETIGKYTERIQLEPWMDITYGKYKRMEKALKEQEAFVESVEKQASGIEKMEIANSEKGSVALEFIKKIRFYSINDYINGTKKYWSALTSTWEERNERNSAVIAKKIGRTLRPFNFFPLYGEEVDRVLDQQLDSKSNEEEEKIKSQLDRDHAKWGDVFKKPDGVFWKFVGSNANKTRGILAYAADHGFLYDLDDNLDNNDHPIFGMKLEDLCFDWKEAGDDTKIANYFTLLRGKNSSGREHEMDHGYKMEFDIADVPRFIRLVEHEMHDENLWAAAGVCKRAMERGLKGHVSAWLFTTVMAQLKHNRNLQSVTPTAFFDIVGKLGLYSTACTLGWLKPYRNTLHDWATSGDDTILEKTPMRIIQVIHDDIHAKKPGLDAHSEKGEQEINELTAKVLAGHIVELPNGPIHIFQAKYDGYRKDVKNTFASMADPHKEDPDFAIEDTEKIMLGATVFKEILAYTSTREFKAEKWVEPFLGNLISLAQRLKATPGLEEAHKNYCTEISSKMDQHLSSYMFDAAAVKQLSTMDTRTNKPALASMVAEGLISWNVIKNAAYIDTLKKQLEAFPEFYATIKDDPLPKKTAKSGKE